MLTLHSPADAPTGGPDVLPFPTVLSFTVGQRQEAAPDRREESPVFSAPTGDAWLLAEAIEVAEWLGCRVVEAELEDHPPGARWRRGRKRVWLDLDATPSERLAVLAGALRGEPRLAQAEMSPALADYLAPRRAA